MRRMREACILLIAGILAMPLSAMADGASVVTASSGSELLAARAIAVTLTAVDVVESLPTTIVNEHPVVLEQLPDDASASTGPGSGTVRVDVTVGADPPGPDYLTVYRFYNTRTGTHFYTADVAERDRVASQLGHLFTYEGIAYRLNIAANRVPLHRFYSPGRNCHFYTADESERARVAATLSDVWTYEGVAYGVSRAPGPGCATVHRFLNVRTGTHFYTIDEAERADVVARLGHVFRYEGGGYWLAP